MLVLTLMEGVGEGYLALRERAQNAALLAELEQRHQTDAGADQSWVHEYVRELELNAEYEWRPYVYFHRKPYYGKHVNIDAAGVRRTWNRTSSPAPGQLKVFMFGGSTLWGVGARDEFTIPSLVSKKLAARLESGVWVMNFGEIGYVSTQEVIALMLELRKGNVPDVVVFFDGVNDTFSAFQSGVAGIPENESHRVAEFNSLNRFNWRSAIIERLALYKLTANVLGRSSIGRLALYRLTAKVLRPRNGSLSAKFVRTDDRSTDALAREVVDVYLQNVSIVDTMAQRFGFRDIFFWQPTVLTKRSLSQRERQWYGEDERWGPSFHKVNAAFRERMRTRRLDNAYDLSGVFDEVSGTMFIDTWHITEAANEKIAELMTQTLLSEVKRRERK